MQPSSSQRGYSVGELIAVIFLLGMLTTVVAWVIGPLLRSQSQTQAKVDTVQAAAMALYRIERDLRNSTVGDIFTCTTGASPTCALAPTALTNTSAIVMPTAYLLGTGPFQLNLGSGLPQWQGATVYWVDSTGALEVAFDKPTGYVVGNTLKSTDAQNAVTDVTTRGGMRIARFVEKIALGIPANHGTTVSFQLTAQSTINGAFNETTYQTDLETRN